MHDGISRMFQLDFHFAMCLKTCWSCALGPGTRSWSLYAPVGGVMAVYTQLELEVLSAAPPLHRFMYTDLARDALLLPKRQPLSYTPPHAPPILAHAASAVGRSVNLVGCVLPLQCFRGIWLHGAGAFPASTSDVASALLLPENWDSRYVTECAAYFALASTLAQGEWYALAPLLQAAITMHDEVLSAGHAQERFLQETA